MGKRRSQHHSQIVRVPSSSRGRAARHDEVIVSGDLSPGRPSSISAYSRPAYPLGQSCRPLTRFPVLARCVAGLAQSTVSLPAYRWLIRCCSLGGPPKDHNASREGGGSPEPAPLDTPRGSTFSRARPSRTRLDPGDRHSSASYLASTSTGTIRSTIPTRSRRRRVSTPGTRRTQRPGVSASQDRAAARRPVRIARI